MLKIEFQGQFKKDYKLALKRGCDPALLEEVITLMANERRLPRRCEDHELAASKEYKGMRECHIRPDWLLIYQILNGTLILRLIRTGSHSDLF